MNNSFQPWYRFSFILIILLAFGLRLFRLDAQSLWYDEGVTAIVAQYEPLRLIQWTAADIQPPFYYLVVAAWGRLAGWSEWSLRFPSVFWGTLLVPLLALLSLRLVRNRKAAILAALLTALHPLLLYHSQEARMYSQLVVLGALAAYCVARLMYCGGDSRSWRYWAGYVVSSILALYTHYFAIFLLIALMLAYGIHILQGAHSSRISLFNRLRPAMLANSIVFLAFLPWLGILLTQLDVDTSYWQGALKLGEALRAVAIRFGVGETLLEAEAVQWLWLTASTTIVCLAVLGYKVVQRRAATVSFTLRNLALIILYLLLPIAGVLTLASFTPKFNPRYVMIALPGLILLWSAGLAQMEILHPRFAIRTLPPVLLLFTLLSGFLRADLNWFTDAAFTKDQWREVASYIQQHRQPDEAVILVSGHAWPIWQYYAPDVELIRLPAREILDVEAVLTFASTGEPLRAQLAGKTGAWLIGWQHEVVDPMRIAQLQLENAGQVAPVLADFWGIELRHFTNVDANAIDIMPPIQSRVDINFGNQVNLIGYNVEPDGDLLLFWKPVGTRSDLHLAGEALTQDAVLYNTVADRRLSAYTYPSFRWQPGEIAVGHIPAIDWAGPGAAPGNYMLRLGVYDPTGDSAGLDVIGVDGQPLGKKVSITVTLPTPTSAILDENPFSWTELASGLFAKASLEPATVEAGQTLVLQVDWWAETLQGLRLQPVWQQGIQTISADTIHVAPSFPAQTWRGEQLMHTRHRVRVPPDLSPGEAQLNLAVTDNPANALTIPVSVTASQRTFTAPPIGLPIDATLGNEITLLGSTASLPTTVTPQGTLELSLVWQAIRSPDTDYTVTVQWLDNTKQPIAQVDLSLPKGTSSWLPGEVVTQPIDLPVPEQPGNYALIIAVYDAQQPGFPRLHLPSGADHVELGYIEIK